VEVFGGEKIGITLVKEIATASFTVEILSYLLLAPRGISIPEKKGGLLSTISRKLNEGVIFSILFNDKFPAGWLKKRQEEERQRLRYMGAEVKTYPRKTILHSKLIIIDRKIALLGSVNLTTRSMTENHEILIKITEQPAIKRLAEIFYTAWNKKK